MTVSELVKAVVRGEVLKRAKLAKEAGDPFGVVFEIGYLKAIADVAEAQGSPHFARLASNQLRRLEEDVKSMM